MKTRFKITCMLLLLLGALTACQPAPVTTPEPETETPKPEAPPAPIPITNENAGTLQAALQKAISTGAVNITWTADSSAFWAEDLYTVLLHDGESAEEIGRFVPGMNSAIHDTSEDGKTIAYSVENDDIRLYNLETESDEIVISTGFPYSTAFFSPDGKTLAAASIMDIKVVFFDTQSGEETGSVSGFSTAGSGI